MNLRKDHSHENIQYCETRCVCVLRKQCAVITEPSLFDYAAMYSRKQVVKIYAMDAQCITIHSSTLCNCSARRSTYPTVLDHFIIIL